MSGVLVSATGRVAPQRPCGGSGTLTRIEIGARVAAVPGTKDAQVAEATRTRVGFGEREANKGGIHRHRLHRIAFWTWRTSVPVYPVANSTTSLWSNSRFVFPTSPTNGGIRLYAGPARWVRADSGLRVFMIYTRLRRP